MRKIKNENLIKSFGEKLIFKLIAFCSLINLIHLCTIPWITKLSTLIKPTPNLIKLFPTFPSFPAVCEIHICDRNFFCVFLGFDYNCKIFLFNFCTVGGVSMKLGRINLRNWDIRRKKSFNYVFVQFIFISWRGLTSFWARFS